MIALRFTRAHVLRRLLALGPMTHAELVDVTGWAAAAVSKSLNYLARRGEAVLCATDVGCRSGAWRLSHG